MIYSYDSRAIMLILAYALVFAVVMLGLVSYVLIKSKGRSRLKVLLITLLLAIVDLGVNFAVDKLDSVDSSKVRGYEKYTACELKLIYDDFYVFREGDGPFEQFFAVPTSADCPEKMKKNAKYYIYTPYEQGTAERNQNWLFFHNSNDDDTYILNDSTVVIRDHRNISRGVFLLSLIVIS